jgi:hypothetical protein
MTHKRRLWKVTYSDPLLIDRWYLPEVSDVSKLGQVMFHFAYLMHGRAN